MLMLIEESWVAKYEWSLEKGEMLKQLIKEKKVTYIRLAKICKKRNRQYVHNLVTGRYRTIDADLLRKICGELEVDISVLELTPAKYKWTREHGDIIKNIIKYRHRITQDKFAHDAYKDDLTGLINTINPRYGVISVDTLYKLARALQITIYDLLRYPQKIAQENISKELTK